MICAHYLVLNEGSYRNNLVNSLMAQHTCLHSSALKHTFIQVIRILSSAYDIIVLCHYIRVPDNGAHQTQQFSFSMSICCTACSKIKCQIIRATAQVSFPPSSGQV